MDIGLFLSLLGGINGALLLMEIYIFIRKAKIGPIPKILIFFLMILEIIVLFLFFK